MRQRAARAAAIGMIWSLSAGCAEILGLEPPTGNDGGGPTGSGGAGTTTATSGMGGADTTSSTTSDIGGSSHGAGGAGGCDTCEPGTPTRWMAFQATGSNALRGVAVTGDSVIVTGTYEGAGANIAGCGLPSTAAGTTSSFVAKLTSTFTCEWVTVLHSDLINELTQVVVWDTSVAVIGTVSGPFTLNDGVESIGNTVGTDALVVTMTLSGGKVERYYVIGGAADDFGTGISARTYLHPIAQIEGPGQVVMLDGGGMTTAPYAMVMGGGGESDILAAGLGTDGQIEWVSAWGSLAYQAPFAVVATDDSVFLAGGVTGATPIGASCVLDASAAPQAFLFGVASASGIGGSVADVCEVWGAASESYALGVDYDDTEGILTTGYGIGPLTLCGQMSSSITAAGWVRIDGKAVPCAASAILAADSTSVLPSRALFTGGNGVVVAGTFKGTYEGQASANEDAFVQLRAGDLETVLWNTPLGAPGADTIHDAVMTPDNSEVAIVGTCNNGIFGSLFACDGAGDGFLVFLKR